MSAKRSRTSRTPAVGALLIDLLLGDAGRAADAATCVGATGAWSTASALAVRWHVLPTLARRLADIDTATVCLERDILRSLRAQAAMSAVRSGAALHHADAALHDLADVGIRAVAIKGVAAIATLYGDASCRMVSDVDIVIRPSDLTQARAALAERGYLDCSPPFERHVSDIALSRTLHNFARTYVRDGFELDMHWQFGPRPPAGLAADRIVERAISATVAGRTLRVAGPIEAALLIAHHALRGAFAASTTVKDLVDLDAWWRVYGRAHGNELVAAACESDLGSSLLALSLVLAAYDSAHPSGPGIAALEARLDRSGRAQAHRLLAFFRNVARGESPDHATVALFAPKVYARSLVVPVCREIAWKASGSAPPPAEVASLRKPIVARLLRRLARGWRIGRDLTQLGRLGTYRAVARAQSRFH